MILGDSLRCLLVAAILACTVGCSSGSKTPAPVVHPVTGKLLNKAGQPLSDGSIEFVSTGAEPKSARSPVATDGSFSLTVMTADGQRFTGAEAGEYRVTYIPRMTEKQTEQPIDLPQRVKIEAKANELNLKLP